MKRLLSYLVNRGFRRGLLDGETLWLVLGGCALALQLAFKVLRRKPEVVYSEKLRPGERLIVTHRPRARDNGRRESPASQP
jgi:hypothetical protein